MSENLLDTIAAVRAADRDPISPDEIGKIAGYKAKRRIRSYEVVTFGKLRNYPSFKLLMWEGIGNGKLERIQNFVYQHYLDCNVWDAVKDSPLFEGWIPNASALLKPDAVYKGLGDYRETHGITINRDINGLMSDLALADAAKPTIEEWDINIPYQLYPGNRISVVRLLSRVSDYNGVKNPNALPEFETWGNLRNHTLKELTALPGIRSPEVIVTLAELGRRHYMIYACLELAEPSPLFTSVIDWLNSRNLAMCMATPSAP